MRQCHAQVVRLALLVILISIAIPVIPSYAQDAAEYRRWADVLRRAVQRCNERLRAGELTSCNVDVGFDVNRIVSTAVASRLAEDYDRRALSKDRESDQSRCLAVRERYLRDMQQIQRMQKTIQMSQQELEEWSKRNEEAKWAAIKSAVNLLVDGGLAYLAESKDALNGLKGALARYENQLERQGRPIDPLQQGKLMDMSKRIVEIDLTMRGARQLQDKKEKAEIIWGYLTANTKDADESMSSFKAALIAAEEDPILHKLLVDQGLMPAVNRLKTKQLFPKKPYLINFLEFARDYGYSVTEWIKSRDLIIQQYQVSDDQLRAVNSMQEELKRTMGALNDCVNKGLVARPQ